MSPDNMQKRRPGDILRFGAENISVLRNPTFTLYDLEHRSSFPLPGPASEKFRSLRKHTRLKKTIGYRASIALFQVKTQCFVDICSTLVATM